MSAMLDAAAGREVPPTLPMLAGPPGRPVAWRHGQAVTLARFLAEAEALAARLPAGPGAVNLCEDRYHFLLAFCALLLAGQVNLLPPSRAPEAVREVLATHPGAYAIADVLLDPAPPRLVSFRADALDVRAAGAIPDLRADRIVAIGYTSGSTGVPAANPKTWGSFVAGTARNAALFATALGGRDAHVVGTVPAQHMYGMETTVLLPLLAPFAVHAGRPLFPADVAQALADLPAPRLLVTTPVHLRALVQDRAALPPLAAIVSATAPLAAELAAAAESRFGTAVIEVFGSTETCVIAARRTAGETDWQLYDGVQLRPQPGGTLVHADWFPEPVLLRDLVEVMPERRFRLCGRHADLLEIAGKRASLGDLTRRLQALDGVEDSVVFQLDADAAGVARLAALVVAPGRSEAELLDALRRAVDPVFLPRPLRRVAALPRNETGKLPRARLIAALRECDV